MLTYSEKVLGAQRLWRPGYLQNRAADEVGP